MNNGVSLATLSKQAKAGAAKEEEEQMVGMPRTKAPEKKKGLALAARMALAANAAGGAGAAGGAAGGATRIALAAAAAAAKARVSPEQGAAGHLAEAPRPQEEPPPKPPPDRLGRGLAALLI